MASGSLQPAGDDLEEACLEKANALLIAGRLPFPLLTSLSSINYKFFIHLFNSICQVPLLDLILDPKSSEDEAHNVQMIIDTLSLDILGLSLAHITGEDIIAGSVSSIYNLLEVFEGYLMCTAPYRLGINASQENGVKANVPDVSPELTTDAANFLCPVCGVRIHPDKVRKRKSTESYDLSYQCSICRGQFLVDGARLAQSSSVTDRTFQSHIMRPPRADEFAGPSISNRVCERSRVLQERPLSTVSNELQERPLSTASSKVHEGSLSSVSKEQESSSSNSSGVSLPRQTVIEEGKLKPQFAGVGVRRTKTGEQTDVKRVSSAAKIDFFDGPSTSGRGKATAPASLSGSTTSTDSSPLLKTVILKEGQADRLKELHPRSRSSISLIPELSESDERRTTTPKRRMSRSLDDIRDIPVEKQDRMVQTSDSLFPKAAKKRKTPSEPAWDRDISDFDDDAHKEIVDLYGKNMENKIRIYLEKNIQHKRRASQINKIYQQALKSPKRKPVSPLCRKSFLLPYYLRRRSVSHTTPKRIHVRSNSQLSQTSNNRRSQPSMNEEEEVFLRELRQEFPGVYLSPTVVRRMSSKYQRHLSTMHKSLRDTLLKKSQTQIQTEEAIKRQQILANILQKEVHQVQHLSDFKEHRDLVQQVKARQRDVRMDSARMKQYHEEFYVEMQKKLQKRNYREEQLIKNVFDEGLNLQKEQIRLLRQQLREREAKDGQYHRIYLDALENFYQTQFSLLAESLAVEKHDMEERTKAQQRVLRMMKRDHRRQMEKEVRSMQQQIVENSEDIHFREKDVERYREKLRDRYSARIH